MHSRGTWYAVSVCVAFFVYLTAVAETLENDAICIVLGGVDYGFGIKGIVNRLAGEVYFGAAAGGKDLWDVRLAQKGPLTNEYCHVSNRSPARSLECVREDRGLRLYWRELDLPGDPGVMDVVVDIRLEDSGASDWTIAIHNRSKIWAQHTVDYPIIRKIMPEGSGTALLPWKNLGGRLFHAYDSRKQDRRGSFCSPGAYLPMAAFMRDGAGLYFAAHDGESRIKKLCVRIGPDVCFSTILENAGCVGKAADSPNYAVTIAPFCGNWWEAAHIYRAWAVRQKWCRKGKVAFRKDFPRIAAEASLWPTTGGSASNMLARIENMKKVWAAGNGGLTAIARCSRQYTTILRREAQP